MIRRPTRSTRTDTLFPNTSLFRSLVDAVELVAVRTVIMQPFPLHHARLIQLGRRVGAVVEQHRRVAAVPGEIKAAVEVLVLPAPGLLDQRAGGVRQAEGFVVATADHVVDEVEAHIRSEEHTSELQSTMLNSYAVLCLKKKIS